MSTAASTLPRPGHGAFRHEALLYDGPDGFLDSTVPFLRDGIDAGEAALVVVAAEKIAALRDALGDAAGAVEFADMAEVGRNPARIIPAWHEFVRRHGARGQPLRGVGEPVWPARTEDELVECQRHEALLNLAFGDGAAWWLLCPYDASSLARDLIDGARRSHPFVSRAGRRADHGSYRPPTVADVLGGDLPAPPADAGGLAFETGPLVAVRDLVARRATAAGLGEERRDDLVLAVNEIASNSIRHAGGEGMLRLWQGPGRIVCEVRDRGQVRDPLVGRQAPPPEHSGGRGLWIANQLCDLVQVRSSAAGTVVRLHMTAP
jgi:anti-sigma regulatory factor (Ser/Thr protein kinase)